MKKISIIWALCFLFGTFYSQINYIGQLNSPSYKVYLVKLAQNGYKYWTVDNTGGKINVYNTNLTLYKTISILFPANSTTTNFYA